MLPERSSLKAPARLAALPFVLHRSHEVIGGPEITSTEETVHGLLRLEGDRLVVQWRVSRETSRVGVQIRTDNEIDAVEETAVPLSAIAGATIRSSRWPWSRRVKLALIAADLRAFETVAGQAGLKLAHPAKMELSIRADDYDAALEFRTELELAIAERALKAAEAIEQGRPPELPGA